MNQPLACKVSKVWAYSVDILLLFRKQCLAPPIKQASVRPKSWLWIPPLVGTYTRKNRTSLNKANPTWTKAQCLGDVGVGILSSHTMFRFSRPQIHVTLQSPIPLIKARRLRLWLLCKLQGARRPPNPSRPAQTVRPSPEVRKHNAQQGLDGLGFRAFAADKEHPFRVLSDRAG